MSALNCGCATGVKVTVVSSAGAGLTVTVVAAGVTGNAVGLITVGADIARDTLSLTVF